MTVGELIEKLRNYDSKALVFADVDIDLKCVTDVSESIGTFINYETDLQYKCPILKLEE